MKTIFYILVALFMTANLISCTADSVADNVETPTDQVATTGEDGHVDPDEDEGGGN